MPTDVPRLIAIPSCNTFQGEAPILETSKRPSPKPNSTNPRQRKKRVFKEGFRFVGDGELQDNLGISLIFKNIGLSIKCIKYTQLRYSFIFNVL